MNINAANLLEKYGLDVLQVRKGRGALIIETAEGLYLLKEYTGPESKVLLQNKVLWQIREAGFYNAEQILADQEGNLIVKDADQNSFICKTYVEGKECDLKNREEVLYMIGVMAKLHSAMVLPIVEVGNGLLPTIMQEFEKRNRELRKVRKFLKKKGQKTDFELFLSQNYEPFLKQAEEIYAQTAEYCENTSEQSGENVTICHGDMQHHNLIRHGKEVFVQGFEKCGAGNQMLDLYRFMRKYLEKNAWSVAAAHQMIETYQKQKPLSNYDFSQLFFRFAYPEKFWKVVNTYYNKGKSFVPGRNGEKLAALLTAEKQKQIFLREFERYL